MPFEKPPEQPSKSGRRINIRKPKEDEENPAAVDESPTATEIPTELKLGARSLRFPRSPEAQAKKDAEAREKEAAYGERLQEARELLGDRVFGPEEVEATFGFRPEKIPDIPYSREDLEKAKELGEMLILRMDKDKEGKPLTMQRIQQMLEPKLQSEGKGKVGYFDWSQSTEPYITQDTPKLEWKLVSMDVLPGSTNKDYIEQTALLRDHLKKNDLATPAELAECTDQGLFVLRATIATHWPTGAKFLSDLLISKNHRCTPVENIYDLVVPLKSRNTRRLENMYNLTNRRNSDGDLVSVGYFDAQGARHGRGEFTGSRASNIGVCSSR